MKTIIPFGDRILVKRKVVGNKLGREGLIVASQETADTATDLAVVVHVPEHTFCDGYLIKNAEEIIERVGRKLKEGDSDALVALLKLNDFLKVKTIKVGDEVFISKYVGITFYDNKGGENLTIVHGEDIIGVVRNE